MHVLIYAMCHMSVCPPASPSTSSSPFLSSSPTPSSLVLLAPKIMLQYFCFPCSDVGQLCALLAHLFAQQTKGKRVIHTHRRHTYTHTPIHRTLTHILTVISACKSKRFKLSTLRVTALE